MCLGVVYHSACIGYTVVIVQVVVHECCMWLSTMILYRDESERYEMLRGWKESWLVVEGSSAIREGNDKVIHLREDNDEAQQDEK